MPTYTFICPNCGRETDTSMPVNLRNSEVYCYCGHQMSRKFNVPAVKIVRKYGTKRLPDGTIIRDRKNSK